MGKKVAIILVNYTGKDFNKGCIDSILKQTYTNFEIIFVDNKSPDWSLEDVKNGYPEIIASGKMKIVENPENYVFAQGNNIGVDHVSPDTEYICLLNNDVTVPENRLQELVKGIESDESLWAVSSLTFDKWYEDEIRKLYLEDKKVIVSNLFGESVTEHVSSWEIEKWLYYTSNLSGCCFFYKREITKQPFLNFYKIYAEDVYLSWFILAKGYKMAICLSSNVFHLWSATMGKNPSPFKLFHGTKNQIMNFLIFYWLWTRVKLFPLFILTQLWHLAVNAPLKRLSAQWKARTRIIRNRNLIKEARKGVITQKKLSDKKFIQSLSYKYSDNIYYGYFGPIKLSIIKIMNWFYKLYCKIFFNK